MQRGRRRLRAQLYAPARTRDPENTGEAGIGQGGVKEDSLGRGVAVCFPAGVTAKLAVGSVLGTDGACPPFLSYLLDDVGTSR